MAILGILTIGFTVVLIGLGIEGLVQLFWFSLRGQPAWTFFLLIIFGLSLYAWWAAHSTQVKLVRVEVDNLQHPSRILYLSDIHIAKKTDLPFLHRLIERINAIDADFVVINWDFIDGRGFDPWDFDILNAINKEVIYTYGNHEAYAGNSYVESLLSPTKLRILSDQRLVFWAWEILGLADMHGFDSAVNRKILAQKLQKEVWETDLPKLLILHEPIGPEVAQYYGINLQLAWHTHNGQLFPFTLFVKFAFPYIKWLYKFDSNVLYVSSGVGTWGPPMRLGSRSEMILLEALPKK